MNRNTNPPPKKNPNILRILYRSMPVTMQMIADGGIDKLYPRGREEKNGVEMLVVMEVVNAVLHAPGSRRV